MSEYYYELIIKPNSHYELFLDLLTNLTNEAIEEKDNNLISRSEDDLLDVKEGIEKFAKALEVECFISYEKKKNEDWIKQYQKSIKSIEVGNFFIRPSWEKPIDEKIDIIIDPALSFGSGHHETTSSCILAIDKYIKPNQMVLDVGCGSGILAICASKKEAIVDICDTDEVCIKDTKSNFALNNTLLNNAWIGSVSKAKNKYDVIIANIVADVLIMISKDLKKCLNNNGILIVSGILDKHTQKVLNKFDDLEIVEKIHKNEWMTIVLKNKEF